MQLGKRFKLKQILPFTHIHQCTRLLCYTAGSPNYLYPVLLPCVPQWAGEYTPLSHTFLTPFQSLVPLGTWFATSADCLEQVSLSHCFWFTVLCQCDSGCNGAAVNQAHPLLLPLLGPAGNTENAKLVSRAKQVQSRGDQPYPKERKHNYWRNTGWSLFPITPFSEAYICTPGSDP